MYRINNRLFLAFAAALLGLVLGTGLLLMVLAVATLPQGVTVAGFFSDLARSSRSEPNQASLVLGWSLFIFYAGTCAGIAINILKRGYKGRSPESRQSESMQPSDSAAPRGHMPEDAGASKSMSVTFGSPASNQNSEPMLTTEKLSLEVEELRLKVRWGIFIQLMPIIATLLGVLVGVAGLLFTIDRTIEEQQKERLLSSQEQIRKDIDTLFLVSHDEQQPVWRVSFLLDDLKNILATHVEERKTVADAFPEYRRNLTTSLILLVRDDLDFYSNPRDIDIANAMFVHWDEYALYLKREPGKLDYILYKYTDALRSLRIQHRGYIESMIVDPKTRGLQLSLEMEAKEPPSLYGHFIGLVDGFRSHVGIISEKSRSETARKEKILRDFQAALCNRAVSELFLDTYFPDEPCNSS